MIVEKVRRHESRYDRFSESGWQNYESVSKTCLLGNTSLIKPWFYLVKSNKQVSLSTIMMEAQLYTSRDNLESRVTSLKSLLDKGTGVDQASCNLARST